MLNVTTAFNEAFKSDLREVKMRIKINDVTYTDEDIVSFNYNAGSIVGDSFAIGSTYANSIKLTLCKIVEGLKQLDEVIPEMGIVLPNGGTEWVKLGTFIISEEVNPDRNENRTSLECTDKMIMLDDIYESKLKYPAKIRDVALEIANLAGVEVEPVSFGRLMENTIQKPVGYTYRQALGLIAQFEAGYVCFDRNGLLAIKQLEDKNYQVTPNEYFLKGLTKNELIFRPAGIQVKVNSDTEEDKVLKIGNEKGSVIRLENKVMTDDLLKIVYDKIKDINYYPYSLNWRGNPAVEVGDWLRVTDLKGNQFKIPNLSYSLEYKGGLTAISTVETVASNEVRFAYKGILDQVVEYVDNVIKIDSGNNVFYGIEEPPNPKEGDVWFKYNGPDTEIWVYEKIGEPDIFDWVLKISSAVDDTIKDKIEELEIISKENAEKADQALLEAEKSREEAKLARQEAFDSNTIARSAEQDALTALALGDGNRTDIKNLEGEQKLTNTKVEGNTADILKLETSSESLKLSIGKVQSDVENINVGSRNYLLKTDEPKVITGVVGAKSYSLYPFATKTLSNFCGGVYGESILIAYKWRFISGEKTGSFQVQFNGQPYGTGNTVKVVVSENNTSGFVVTKTTSKENWDTLTSSIGLRTDDLLCSIEISEMRLLKSNTLSDWSLSPEERLTKSEFATFEASYKGFQQTVSSDITGLQSQQTQMDGQISSVVKDVNGLETEVTQLSDQWAVTAQEVKTIDGIVSQQQSTIAVLTSQIDLKVNVDEVISRINLSPEQILIKSKLIHLSGQSKIDDAIITSAMIKEVSADKLTAGEIDASIVRVINVEAENIVGKEIKGISLTSISGEGYFNVQGSDAVLYNARSAKTIKLSDSGIKIYDRNNRLVSRLDDFVVNTRVVGTATTNIYLATGGNIAGETGVNGGEVRAVEYLDEPGDGQVTSYKYTQIRARGFVGSYLNANTPIGETHVYLRPKLGDGEVRVTASGSVDQYQNIRVREISANVLQYNGLSAGVGKHVYIRPRHDGEVYFTKANTTNDTVPINARKVRATAFTTLLANSNLYLGMDGELRVTGTNLASGVISYKPVRASAYNNGSLAEYKQFIRPYEDNALDLINQSTVYTYQLRNRPEVDEIGLVIGDGYDITRTVVDGDGVNQYRMSSLAWKAIQELSAKIEQLEKELRNVA